MEIYEENLNLFSFFELLILTCLQPLRKKKYATSQQVDGGNNE